jgi:hypothetical protein
MQLSVLLMVAWVYLPVCFDFLQTADERWLYGCIDWLLSQSLRWKYVLLKGSPQWRSTLDEQLQHLSPAPVNIKCLYKTWGCHDDKDLDCAQNYWFLGFVRRPEFKILETECFGNWICFRPQMRGGRHLLCWVP